MKPLRLSRTGGIAVLDFDRPPANVLDLEALRAAALAVTSLRAGETRALLVTGRPNFSAGVDVADHTPEKIGEMLPAIHGFLASLLEAPFPTLAAVRGACLGGGAEIALCCDLLFAAGDARIGFPEITLACFPPAAILLLPAVAGPARAAELILSGEAISGKEAERTGLASRCVPGSRLDAVSLAFLRDLASRSQAAVDAAFRLLREPRRRAFEEGRARAEAAYRGLAEGPDLGRAVEDFARSRETRRRNRMKA